MKTNKLKMSVKDDVLFRYSLLCSANVGIISTSFMHSVLETDMPKMHSLSAEIPKYSRFIFQDERDISFHLSGYDTNIDGSLLRLCGEVAERYSSLMAHTLVDEKNFVKDSYANLIKENKDIIDWKWFSVYSKEKITKISEHISDFAKNPLSINDKINWVKIYSIFDEKEILIPAQMFFLGYPSKVKDEKKTIISMSTGTATHVNFQKALKNALMESIQINAFIKSWYYNYIDVQELIIDDQEINNELNQLIESVHDLVLKFHYYQDKESDLIIVGCYVLNKQEEFPVISYGVQASTSKKEAVIRAAMEALAVHNVNFYNYLYHKNPKEIECKAEQNKEWFGNLDKNVFYFATKKYFEKNWKFISSKVKGQFSFSKIKEIDYKNDEDINSKILKTLRKNKRDVYIMDITAPEIKDYYSVVRIFIPQFVPVFIPSMPYDNHPEIKDLELNDYIHPLA